MLSKSFKRTIDETLESKLERLKYERNKKKIQRTEKRLKAPILNDNFLPNFIDETITEEHYAGPLDRVCKHCGSKNFASEKNCRGEYKCCHAGKVYLPPSPPIPDMLERLYKNDTDFFEYIRFLQ